MWEKKRGGRPAVAMRAIAVAGRAAARSATRSAMGVIESVHISNRNFAAAPAIRRVAPFTCNFSSLTDMAHDVRV